MERQNEADRWRSHASSRFDGIDNKLDGITVILTRDEARREAAKMNLKYARWLVSLISFTGIAGAYHWLSGTVK